MKRACKQQEPEHAFQKSVGEIDPADDRPRAVVNRETGDDKIQTNDHKRCDQRHDKDTDRSWQPQEKVIYRSEKAGQNDKHRR